MKPAVNQRKVSALFWKLYFLVILGLLGSVGFAVFQNWDLHLQTSRSNLARQAGIANFIASNAIAHANKSLTYAQELFLPAIQKSGALKPAQAREVLHKALDDFQKLSSDSSTQYQGLMIYLDAQGRVVARTDLHSDEIINLTDRLYYQRLKNNPLLEQTLSPLVKARTTGEWVFHVAVPLRGKHNEFQGVLVQQIRTSDIARELSRYINIRQSRLVITQYAEIDRIFAHPPEGLDEPDGQTLETDRISMAAHARHASSPQDAFIWSQSTTAGSRRYLVGYEHSELSGLMTTIHLPMTEVWLAFLRGNLFLFSIAAVALVLVSVIFRYLYKTSSDLTDALHDASNDALTQIPNRRAFEDVCHRLVRDALRTQSALSVLFIDIDHFKHFNDDYGHDGGDVALQGVARSLSGCISRPLDFVCRWGGEEFVVILPHTDVQAAQLLAQKMMEAVRAMRLQDAQGHPMRPLTISIGIASAIVKSVAQGEALVFEADTAMQAAKSQGRDRIVVQASSAA